MFETTSNPPAGNEPARNSEIVLFDVHGHQWRWGTDPDGTPWAVASDVAKSFDYRDASNCIRVLDEDEKGTRLVSTPTGQQEQRVVYEDGLWELVFRSGKPEAKALKKRIKEILRDLRAGELQLVPQQRRELTNRELAQMILDEADRADAAEAQVAVLAPAAESWQVLASAEGDFSVADAAKILSRDPQIKIGQNRLFKMLGELGWAFRQRGDNAWRVYQTAVDAGRLSEIPQSHYHPRNGELVLDPPKVRVTAKGLDDLRRLLGGSEGLPLGDALLAPPRSPRSFSTRPGDNRP